MKTQFFASLVFLFFLGSAITIQAQGWTVSKTISDDFTQFTADNLENVYTLRKHELKKFRPDGTLWLRFSNISLGDISFVDVTNPLKILVFYKDFSRIQFLDNMLAERSAVIQLQQLGFDQAVAVCTSFDNGFWLFDQLNFELVRFNQDFVQTQDIKNLNQILGYEFIPNFITEHNNWVYMNVPEKGILVFDIYGTYFKTIPITGLPDFQVDGDLVYYLQAGKSMAYNMKTLQTSTLELADTVLKFCIVRGRIFSQADADKKIIKLWSKP